MSVLFVDNGGEFPGAVSGNKRGGGKWKDVYSKISQLEIGVSHVRVLVVDMKTAKSLVTSCFVMCKRTGGYRLETRTATSEDGVYVYIRKIEE